MSANQVKYQVDRVIEGDLGVLDGQNDKVGKVGLVESSRIYHMGAIASLANMGITGALPPSQLFIK